MSPSAAATSTPRGEIDLPPEGSGRAVTVLESEGRPIAALIHDEFLRHDPEIVEAVAAAARLAIVNEGLRAEVRAKLAEVQASRARIVEAGDAERRRVERNLHDGAQQRLVTLMLAAGLLKERLTQDRDAHTAAQVDGLSTELRQRLGGAPGTRPGDRSGDPHRGGTSRRHRFTCRSVLGARVHRQRVRGTLARGGGGHGVLRRRRGPHQCGQVRPRISGFGPPGLRRNGLRVEVADDGRGGADLTAGSGLRGLEGQGRSLLLAANSPSRAARGRHEGPSGDPAAMSIYGSDR